MPPAADEIFERAENGIDVIEAPAVMVGEVIWAVVNKGQIAEIEVDTTPNAVLRGNFRLELSGSMPRIGQGSGNDDVEIDESVDRGFVEVVAVVSDERGSGFVSGGEVQKVEFVECDIL